MAISRSSFEPTFIEMTETFFSLDDEKIQFFWAQFIEDRANWTRALCCAFYRMGHNHLVRLAELNDREISDFYEMSSNDFANEIYEDWISEDPDEADNSKEEMQLLIDGHTYVLEYDQGNKVLTEEKIFTLAQGYRVLMELFTFFCSPSLRRDRIETLAGQVAGDMFD
jgi:hypothetical protein